MLDSSKRGAGFKKMDIVTQAAELIECVASAKTSTDYQDIEVFGFLVTVGRIFCRRHVVNN
jgi:hypothetical protein